MLRIITAAIAGSVVIFVICTLLSRKGWPTKMHGTGAGWKIPFVFLWRNFLMPKKLIMWTLIVGAGYGIYLMVNYCAPPKNERLAKTTLQKQMERKLAEGPEKRLAEINNEAKKRLLTAAEEDEVVKKNKEAESIRKEYSIKLKPPHPLQKEEVWDWTFEWEATAEQLASGRQKIVGRINDAQVISRNANVLKFRYKRPSGKIVNLTLDRNDPKEFYFGRVAQNDLYLRVWLFPDEKGNFNGRFDNGPGKISMEVFLKKKS